MYKNILVPLDRSDFAERALPFALGVAGASGGRVHLTLVHSLPFWGAAPEVPTPIFEEADSLLRTAESQYLETLASHAAAESGVECWPHLLEGRIIPALRDFGDSGTIDLITMSTHGHGGLTRAWLGSVTDALLRHCTLPMVLVRPDDDYGTGGEPWVEAVEAPMRKEGAFKPRRFSHLLTAVDGSAIADEAAKRAAELAALHGATITLLRVVRPPLYTSAAYLPHMVRLNREEIDRRMAQANVEVEALAGRLREGGLSVGERVVVDYHPAEAILREADHLGIDLITLGTHGRGGVRRLVLGSVADKVIRGSALPVFVLPANAIEAAEIHDAEEQAMIVV
jgi:nucleotide-binding universal stress UspA family protein